MKHFYLIICTLFVISASHAQQIYLETGLGISNFEFTNNEVQSLEGLQGKTKNYIAAGYKHPFFVKGLHISAGVIYDQYGASGSNNALDLSYEWDVQYLGLDAGFDFDFLQTGDWSFFVNVHGSGELLVKGTQRLNNQVIDVKEVEEFDDTAYFLRTGGGFSFSISERSSLYLRYTYGYGFPLNDNNNSQVTELKINSHHIGIGAIIKIPCKEKEEEVPFEDTNETLDNETP